MRVAFIVNHVREPSAEQTTTLLITAALRLGHRVFVAGVGDLTIKPDGETVARGCALEAGDVNEVVTQLRTTPASSFILGDLDLCIVRSNPGRDECRQAVHRAALRTLEGLQEKGVCVINSPRGLSRGWSKLSLLDIPVHLRPETLVTRDASEIKEFIGQHSERSVIKPLQGTRGADVFVLDAHGSNSNTNQIIESVLRQGYAMVQAFVSAPERGDVRVTVIDGHILECEGQYAAVARVPRNTDFRSNLHAGGEARPAVVTSVMREAVSTIAPHLEREGLFHVGIDFVGGRILELNVFSPGGLYPSERLYRRDFATPVIEAFERRARPAEA